MLLMKPEDPTQIHEVNVKVGNNNSHLIFVPALMQRVVKCYSALVMCDYVRWLRH